ncbi:MAG: hypothetical protein LiPW41_510 [Parcubacteria group bacterium LiPW_41]|nr:MAG: hypothetical protein LiPW41_510 [Parcubacteria group bacterium LiPW_41]
MQELPYGFLAESDVLQILNSIKYISIFEKEKIEIFEGIQEELQNEIMVVNLTGRKIKTFSPKFVETLKLELNLHVCDERYFNYFKSNCGRDLVNLEDSYCGRKVSGKPSLDYYDNR